MSEPLSEDHIERIRMFHTAFADALGKGSEGADGALLQFVAYAGVLLAEVDRLRAELESVDEAIRSERVLELEYRHEMESLIFAQRDKMVAALEQVAAMRPIVEAVAEVEPTYSEQPMEYNCVFCGAFITDVFSDVTMEKLSHAIDCAWLQARALLAKEGDA